jgi:hypothetical protein
VLPDVLKDLGTEVVKPIKDIAELVTGRIQQTQAGVDEVRGGLAALKNVVDHLPHP